MRQRIRLGKTTYAGKGVGLLLGIPNSLQPYDRESFMAITTIASAVITIAIVPMLATISIIVSRPPFWIPTSYASTLILEQVK